MERKGLYDAATFGNVLERIDRITPESAPEWGSMNAAQMFGHCAEITEVAMGKELKGTPFFIRLISPLIRRSVLSDKPYSKNSPTHPQYVYSDPVAFEEQKARLLAVLKRFQDDGPRAYMHTLFGTMTPEESGWVGYKHLDHHLKQFGV